MRFYRILVTAPFLRYYNVFQAYRTKSVCENPYNTSKYLVL